MFGFRMKIRKAKIRFKSTINKGAAGFRAAVISTCQLGVT